jgi:Gpi18-like mannosyltransferase/predicted membrane-bound dolichyl-phosphate-mannose-protein mannosyltransferase
VTSPQADGADRFSRAAERPLRASAAAPALAILLLLGLVLRLTIAYVLWPGSGFETDIATYTAWASRLYEFGPGSFYESGMFADYPPAYLYVLWLGSHVMAFLHGGNFAAVPSDALKLGPILADIAVGAALYVIARRWAGERPDAARLGLIAAGLYLFNPVTWYDSALWGQTDAAGALVILLCVGALVRGNSEGAAALAVLAALVKPQFGVVAGPIVAAVLLRRHLLAPGSGPRERPWAPVPVARWLSQEQGLIRIVSSAAVGLITMLVVLTPFGLSVPGFVERMAGTAGGYPWLSVNAYNPWALVGSDGQQPLALGGGWSPDTVAFLGPLPAVVIGGALLVVAFLLGMLRLGWRDDRRSIVLVAIFLALAFFVLPTRVHERYLFPVFGLVPLLAVLDRRWLVALIGLSVGAFINFHGILTMPLYATPNLEELPLGAAFREPPAIVLSVLVVLAAFAFNVRQLRPAAAHEPDPYEGGEAFWPEEPAGAAEYAPMPVHGSAGRLGSARGWLRQLVAVVPLRRDRSPELAGERGGRIDRLDLLLLVLVLLATLGLRTFRLEKPFGMHFDEVYHARTATEFLQHWQYGIRHTIYEYTHPHLAKYAMALGIVALGNNRVVDEQPLDTAVTAAAIERRWSPNDAPGRRFGDRLYAAAGDEVHVFDLADRRQVATLPVAARLVNVDDDGHELFMADSAGGLWRLPTDQLDALRDQPDAVVPAPEPLATLQDLQGEPSWLGFAAGRVIVLTTGGSVISVDPTTGAEGGRTQLEGAAEAQAIGSGERVVADPAEVTDAPAVAARLAELLDDDAARIGDLLATVEGRRVTIAGYLTDEQAEALGAALEEEELTGVMLENGPAVAVAAAEGVAILDADTLDELALLATDSPATGLALVERGLDRPTIYAAAGSAVQTIRIPEDGPPELATELDMPNAVRDTIWNPSTALLHVLGTTQDGSSPTIYVLAPVTNAFFADAPLPFEPLAVLLDAQPRHPADDRANLLAIDADGSVATVDAGSNAFAWRFPGVLAGALMAACIYLLGRFLFSRRSVAVIAALLVLADGMFFANARIAMNDAYVSLFIVAAFTIFAPLWLGRWRSRSAIAVGMLAVGVLLGLALASKWVAAYAIGAVGLLILLRSALGRLIALVAMIGLTGVLGYLAIAPSPDAVAPQLNFLFLLVMLGLTVALAVLMALRPVRLTLDELRLMVVGPVVAGAVLLLAGIGLGMAGDSVVPAGLTAPRLLLAGGVLLGAGGLAYLGAHLAGRLGSGPLAGPVAAEPGVEPATPPAPRGWLRPGSGLLGLPWLAALAVITVIPLGIYILSYVPWIELGNRWAMGLPAGHTGQLFLDLQFSMYDYHNNLRATHAASSPWWAWPFDLKPVWFYKEDFAGGTTAQIYDAGNPVLFWLAVPALGFAAFQAWRRRSLPLTLVVVAVACLWLPWARIDRVAFQYHIFTSLPLWFLALAYFLAELWHGSSARTWLLARVAAAAAIVGPAALWLLRLPLCGVARTEQVNPGTEVCGALARTLALTDMQALGVLAAASALVLVGWLLWLGRHGTSTAMIRSRPLLLPIMFVLALGGGALVVLGAALPGRPVVEWTVRAEEPALVMLLLLAVPAYLVLRARDARRYVAGVLAAAFTWFVIWYPNLAALPVPSTLSEIYQGLLPTWNYAFQFGSNQDAPNRSPMDFTSVGMLVLLTAMLVVAAIYVARAWRTERAEERVLRTLREPGY